mmetsp:Transcript_44934/g.101710  ORF Transcript_44934/g.101710 Transcript_44934/m.101710 type:complete len:217 (-) Transcript_44934:392-1042(-)
MRAQVRVVRSEVKQAIVGNTWLHRLIRQYDHGEAHLLYAKLGGDGDVLGETSRLHQFEMRTSNKRRHKEALSHEILAIDDDALACSGSLASSHKVMGGKKRRGAIHLHCRVLNTEARRHRQLGDVRLIAQNSILLTHAFEGGETTYIRGSYAPLESLCHLVVGGPDLHLGHIDLYLRLVCTHLEHKQLAVSLFQGIGIDIRVAASIFIVARDAHCC